MRKLLEVLETGKKEKYKVECKCGKISVVRKQAIDKDCGSCANTQYTLKEKEIKGVWYGIRTRCYDVNSSNYQNYGGRGIICEWITFREFYIDMQESYFFHIQSFGKGNTTIERKDVNGNYCKENCRWATLKEQTRNTRRNVYYLGKCISEWCEFLNIDYTVTIRDIKKGRPIGEALGII